MFHLSYSLLGIIVVLYLLCHVGVYDRSFFLFGSILAYLWINDTQDMMNLQLEWAVTLLFFLCINLTDKISMVYFTCIYYVLSRMFYVGFQVPELSPVLLLGLAWISSPLYVYASKKSNWIDKAETVISLFMLIHLPLLVQPDMMGYAFPMIFALGHIVLSWILYSISAPKRTFREGLFIDFTMIMMVFIGWSLYLSYRWIATRSSLMEREFMYRSMCDPETNGCYTFMYDYFHDLYKTQTNYHWHKSELQLPRPLDLSYSNTTHNMTVTRFFGSNALYDTWIDLNSTLQKGPMAYWNYDHIISEKWWQLSDGEAPWLFPTFLYLYFWHCFTTEFMNHPSIDSWFSDKPIQ